MMFSPVQAEHVDCEPCDAHLIPEALGVSNATVVNERVFDNLFGAKHDSKLIQHVGNMASEWKDIRAAFIDEKTNRPLNTTPIRTKWRHAGPRPENVTILLNLKENLKKHVNLAAGSVLKIMPHSPSLIDCASIGLSMLHSAFLTMYYHFGKDYVSRKEADSIRALLQDAIREKVADNTSGGPHSLGAPGVVFS